MGKTIHKDKIKRTKVRDPNFAPMLKRKSGPHKDRRRAIQEELDKLEQDLAVEQALLAEDQVKAAKFSSEEEDNWAAYSEAVEWDEWEEWEPEFD